MENNYVAILPSCVGNEYNFKLLGDKTITAQLGAFNKHSVTVILTDGTLMEIERKDIKGFTYAR